MKTITNLKVGLLIFKNRSTPEISTMRLLMLLLFLLATNASIFSQTLDLITPNATDIIAGNTIGQNSIVHNTGASSMTFNGYTHDYLTWDSYDQFNKTN